MKKLLMVIPLVFLLCFTFSCQQGEEVVEEQTYIDTEKIIQAWINLNVTKDLNLVDGLYSDDGVYEDVPDNASYDGKEKIRKYLSEMFTYAPDMEVENKATFLSKDWAIVEWIWSGTQTGDIEGLIEATGNKFSIRGTSILEFQEGKIKRQADYYDAGGFLYQLGVKLVFPSGKIIEKDEEK